MGEGVEIGAYSIVGPNVRLGDGTRIMPQVFLDGWTTLGQGCVVFPFASIGSQTQDLKYRGGRTSVEIGDRTTLREYVTVNSGTSEGDVTRVGSDCLIMAYCHVAHQCQVGNEVIMSNGTNLAGHIVVEDQAVLAGMTGVHQFVRIGRMCMIGGMSRIAQDVPPFMLVEGNPPVVHGPNKVGLERRGASEEVQSLLKRAFRILYRDGLSTRQALDRLRAELTPVPEIRSLVEFIEKSERGIIK